MLPETEDGPAEGVELPSDADVAGLVALDLRLPVGAVAPWRWDRAVWTPVPEAAVDEDGQADAREDDVGRARQLRPKPPSADPSRPQRLAECDFWLGVRLANPRHHPRADLGLRKARYFSQEEAANAVQSVYLRNVFPNMDLEWGYHPNNIGHEDFPGCFRCHSGNLEAKDGTTVSADCEACHQVLAMEEENPEILTQLGLK